MRTTLTLDDELLAQAQHTAPAFTRIDLKA